MYNSAIFALIAIGALVVVFDRLIVRGEDRRRLTDLKQTRMYSIVLNSLLVGSLTAVALMVGVNLLFFQLTIVISVLFAAIQAFLEKRYLPNTRRHISTLLSAGSVILILGIFILTNPFV